MADAGGFLLFESRFTIHALRNTTHEIPDPPAPRGSGRLVTPSLPTAVANLNLKSLILNLSTPLANRRAQHSILNSQF